MNYNGYLVKNNIHTIGGKDGKDGAKDGAKDGGATTGGKKKEKKGGGNGNDDGEGKKEKVVSVLDHAAMENAYNICHSVQDLLYFRGFFWEGAGGKGKGKGKGRKKKGKKG